jgi:hypothetical protein
VTNPNFQRISQIILDETKSVRKIH